MSPRFALEPLLQLSPMGRWVPCNQLKVEEKLALGLWMDRLFMWLKLKMSGVYITATLRSGLEGL